MTDVSEKAQARGSLRDPGKPPVKPVKAAKRRPATRRLKPCKAATGDRPGAHEPDPELVACVELLYFAYRDFTSDPDAVLADYGFGRAHHRVLHFVHRNHGLKVAELLDILRITKQSLGRVLKQLIDEGFVIQKAGAEDRRERRLYLSPKGVRLANKLTDIQTRRMQEAFASLGPKAEDAARAFLVAMISEDSRPYVARLIDRADKDAAPDEDDATEGRIP